MLQPIFNNSIHSNKQDLSLLISRNRPVYKKSSIEEKSCKHRNENGWCTRTQRQCPLLNLNFINS